jgi:hypothetical protein
MRSFTKRMLFLGLITSTALTAASAAQDTMAGKGVSFVNEGDRRIEIYTRYGSDASCGRRPKRQTVIVAPEQTVTVDAEGSICFCLQVPERGTCATGWTEVEAGGTRRLQ